MARTPSPYRYALTEPWHFVGLFVWLALTLTLDHHLAVLGIGLGVEALYLGGFARSSVYRRRAALRADRNAARARRSALQTRSAVLRRDVRRRYRRIESLYQEVRALLEQGRGRWEFPAEVREDTLDELIEKALEFSVALQTIEETLKKRPPRSLKSQLQAMKTSAGASGADQDEAASVLARRIAYLESLEAQAEKVRAQLATIEQTFLLLSEQFAGLDTDIKPGVDTKELVSSVEAARATAEELRALQLDGVARVGQ